MSGDVIIGRKGRLARISLHRPRALHALTAGMIGAMTASLLEWADDDGIALVLLDHQGDRGFCAGADIGALRRSALEDDGASGRAFFRAEYQLNHLLHGYAKPVVAMMDGVTMGGGVGLSLPARYRIATQNTRFAMPESAIGLFPDVGGGWYLPRLPGRVGAFLALTGARLDGADCLTLGLATHFLPSDRLAEARSRLAATPDRVEAVLAELAIEPPAAAIGALRAAIDRLFASDRLEEIWAALAKDGGEWALGQLALLRTRSPQTCKVALRQLALGARCASFTQVMKMEYRIAARLLSAHDFIEGVRAVIIDKDNAPRWNPVRPEDVTDVMLDAIFAPLPDQEEWAPLAEAAG